MNESSSKSFEDALCEAFGEVKRSKRIQMKRNARESVHTSKLLLPDKKAKRIMNENDSDDDFEIVSCTDSIKWFYPTDINWQRSKCEEFKLTLKKELDFNCGEPVPATAPLEVIDIEGDGNCFFRCLAYLITGVDDKSHKSLRQKLVKFMKQNEKLVEGLGGRNYLSKSLMWTDGMWPTEVEIYASACMLDTDIYTYMDGGKWLRFSSSGKLEISNKVERAIYLVNTENVHYDVVVQVQEPKLLPPSRVYIPTRLSKKKPQPIMMDVTSSSNSVLPTVSLEVPNNPHHSLITLKPPPCFPRKKLDISYHF